MPSRWIRHLDPDTIKMQKYRLFDASRIYRRLYGIPEFQIDESNTENPRFCMRNQLPLVDGMNIDAVGTESSVALVTVGIGVDIWTVGVAVPSV